MPRRQKLHHYIYKTTCLVTGKFYVGMHSTDDPNDGYLGSGKILGYSRKKHGDENHKKEILEYLPTREALKLREKEIVNEALLADPLNINLKYGGEGGFDHLNSPEAIEKRRWTFAVRSKAGREAQQRLMQDPEYAAKRLAQQREIVKIAKAASMAKHPEGTFKNRCHSAETRVIMSKSHQGKHLGSKNSQFGTCWMSKDGKSIKVKREHIDEYLTNGYLLGRGEKECL